MATKILKHNVQGFIFCCALGTLMHFLYKWSGGMVIAGIFCPVNESVWEHLKMIFYPFILWTLFEYYFLRESSFSAFSVLNGVLCGMIATLSVYYIYAGASGKSNLAADIFSFILGVAVTFTASKKATEKAQRKNRFCETFSVLAISSISLLFTLFTFIPPNIPLFIDITTSTYGIQRR